MKRRRKKQVKIARRKAATLLHSPYFFHYVAGAVRKLGLVGERRNALVVFVVAVSRLLERPLNLLVRGLSSAGKNFLVKAVLKLFPEDCVFEISSQSERALNYLHEQSLEHTIVYIFEYGDRGSSARPNRLLLSEGKLVHWVTTPGRGGMGTERKETAGPVASISTTTAEKLAVDDESRHLSIWLDESADQTKRIVLAHARNNQAGLKKEELKVWHEVQRLLKRRSRYPIKLPEWFGRLVESLPAHDVRVRRYFPAFLQACKTVCLIRSFRLDEKKVRKRGRLTVSTSATG